MRYKTNLKMEDIFPERSDGLCRRCQKTLTGKQQKWCSKDCSYAAFDELMIAKGSSTYIRKAVFKRDNGICANCKIDTEKVQRIFERAQKSILIILEPFRDQIAQRATVQWLESKFIENGVFKRSPHFGVTKVYNLWEADHIIEVINGGSHSLDNLQTLCIPCHKTKTRNLHKSRTKTPPTNQPNLF